MYYIANFQHFTDQEQPSLKDRRHGSFSMMVEAPSMETALEMFRLRLKDLRKSSELFTGQCQIYVTQLLEFAQFPAHEAALLNLKSFAGDPLLPFISCVVPNDQSDACTIQSYSHQGPTTEGQPDSLFLEFDARQ